MRKLPRRWGLLFFSYNQFKIVIMRKILILLIILSFLGCVNQNSTNVSKTQSDKEHKTLSQDEIIQQKVTKDSLRLVNLKKKEKQIKELKKMWCNRNLEM